MRTARKSDGGFGKSSDGGCGGFMVAHAANIKGAANTSAFVAGYLMEKKPDYQKPPATPDVEHRSQLAERFT